jgi:fructokinase
MSDGSGAPIGPNPVVLSLGEALIDFIVSDEAPRLEDASVFVARPGGAPANVAVALARLGVPSAFCGVVGDDPFGRRLRSTLRAEGVDVSRLRSTPEAETTLAFAWKDEQDDGHFRLLRGADALLAREDAERAGIEGLAAIVVGSVSLAAEPSGFAVKWAAALAVQKAVPVCFDVNVRPSLWPDLSAARDACRPILERAILIKLSLDDARALFASNAEPETTVERLRSGPEAPIVVLTDGARGCWYASGRSDHPVRHVPAFAVDAAEPTGAGDAFTAALLSRLLASDWAPPDDADIRYAAAAGALATTRPGALDGLPSRAELDAFLSAR